MLPNDLVVYSKGSFKDNSRIKRGWGEGGLSLIWQKSIDHITSRVQVKTNGRVQCMTLELPGCKVLLINSYFPQDPQHDNFDEQDLLGCLTTMKSLIENHPHDQLIILFLDHSYSSPCCTHFSLVVHLQISRHLAYKTVSWNKESS